VILWTSAAALAGGCPEETTFQALARAILSAEQAIRDSDRAALEGAERDAERLVRCMESPLRPADVASFMRLKGIALFVRKERDAAGAWFAASRRVEPSYSLPEALFPERHPLRRAFEDSPPEPGDTARLPRPAEGALAVNGRTATDLPEDAPWVLQWSDAGGRVQLTTFGERPPETWPYPLRFERGRAQVVLSATGQLAPSARPGDLRYGLQLAGIVELGGPRSVDVGVRSSLTRASSDDGAELLFVPGAHLGGRGWFDVAGIRSFAGAALLVTSHRERAVAPGGLAVAGVRLGSPRQFLELALEGGYSLDPFVQLQVGAGLGR